MTARGPVPMLRRIQRALRRAGIARVVVGLWLALHGFAVAAAPVADALAGHGESVVAHWEDAQDTSCPPLHDPAACQLCQQIATGLSDGPAPRMAPVAVVRRAWVRPDAVGLAAHAIALRDTPDPRGPPTV